MSPLTHKAQSRTRSCLLLSAWLLLICGWPTLAEDTQEPSLMLAEVYRPGVDLSLYLVSEKLDGVRAYWDGKRLVSRQGNPIEAPAWFTQGVPPISLDGELWMGRGTFETLSGIVRRQVPNDDAWRPIRFMVFDLPASPLPFRGRLDALRTLVETAKLPNLQVVEQFRVADHRELMAHLDRVVKQGGEGLMLHRADSRYRAARTGDLLKLKPYEDAEATVIAHLPGKGKYTGMLGALLVETEERLRFRIGSGFTDAQRRSPPPLGSIVTYRFRGKTRTGKPRFASFLRIYEPF